MLSKQMVSIMITPTNSKIRKARVSAYPKITTHNVKASMSPNLSRPLVPTDPRKVERRPRNQAKYRNSSTLKIDINTIVIHQVI